MKTLEAPVLERTVSASSLMVERKKGEKEKAVSRLLQDILNFGIIDPLDLRLILECRFLTDVSVDLEAGGVQGVSVLFATNVVDEHRPGLHRSFIRLRFPNVGRSRQTAIAGVLVVVEIGNDVAGLTAFQGGGCLAGGMKLIIAEEMGCCG